MWKCFLGKFGPKNWTSPTWLKFGTGIHCYALMLCAMPRCYVCVSFFKVYVIHFSWANLIPKSEVSQINWNLEHGYIAICLLQFSCLSKNFVTHVFWANLFLQIEWCGGMDCCMIVRILMFIFANILSSI